MGFWEQLKKEQRGDENPFFALAPMADVTDVAFRSLFVKYGKPDVLWTEFVSSDGLASAGREVLKRDLEYTEGERPIVAQLFSSNVEKMRQAAKFVAELGFDGIDINMGCPDKSIEKQGCGSAMIKTPEIAARIIQATKDGIADAGKNIPVSVKTRVGYNKVEIDTWIPFLLSQDIACLTIHARTRKDLSKVPAKWEYVKEVVAIRDNMNVPTLIVGNGDVENLEQGRKLAKETGCDGIMVGRAAFGNPWLFATNGDIQVQKNFLESFFAPVRTFIFSLLGKKNRYWLKNTKDIPTEEKLRVLVEHAELFEKKLGDVKNFAIMKKHFKAYVHGFPGSKELRVRLMEEGNSASVVKEIVEKFLIR
jgi:nifR3 family TIM-barrel protein